MPILIVLVNVGLRVVTKLVLRWQMMVSWQVTIAPCSPMSRFELVHDISLANGDNTDYTKQVLLQSMIYNQHINHTFL